MAIKLNVESQTILDGNNKFVSKFFHNKVSAGVYETTKAYTQTANPRFLLEILGPLGVILTIISVAQVIDSHGLFLLSKNVSLRTKTVVLSSSLHHRHKRRGFSLGIKKPKSIFGLVLGLVAIASLFLILPIDPRKTFYLVAVTWYLFSLKSASKFARSKKSIAFFLLLLISSFWYFAFSWQMTAICNEVFFN